MIESIHIFGQRCSGTNYLFELISKNYPDIQVKEGGPGWKHMWQCEKNLKKNNFPVNNSKILYIFIVRNVFDWVSSFKRQPHHCKWAVKLTVEEMLNRSPFDSYHPNGHLLETYENIIESRIKKFSHVLDYLMVECCTNSELIQYENLEKNPQLLTGLLEKYGVEVPKNFENISYYKKMTSKIYQPTQYEPLSDNAKKYIIEKIDWSLEKKLGYEKPI